MLGRRRSWRENWGVFVKEVAELFARGLPNRDVSQHFAGQRVLWRGKLAATHFGRELGVYHPGVQMDMPAVTVYLPDGRYARVNYLSLTLKESDVPLWQGINIGATLDFATEIRGSDVGSAGIEWVELEDKKGVIMFVTNGGVPVKT